jgi:peptidylprolyl isomerase
MGVTLFGARPKDLRNPQGGSLGVGFYRGLPVATEPSSAAIMTVDGKVQAYGLHCKGVTSMARTADPNSANSQIFLMRGMAPNLDNKYSIWGNTVWGRENLTKIAVGTVNQTPGFIPEKMDRVQVAADVPAADRVNVQVLKSDSAAFKTYLNSKKNADGTYPDICEIDVPTRLKP